MCIDLCYITFPRDLSGAVYWLDLTLFTVTLTNAVDREMCVWVVARNYCFQGVAVFKVPSFMLSKNGLKYI